METFAVAPHSYRFGHVIVEVYPEIVVLEVPYGAEHDDYCDASIFAQRYTHGTDAFVTEDDEQQIQLRIYPNVENLVGQPPFVLPPLDCRVGLWDPPSAIRPGPIVELPDAQPIHHTPPTPGSSSHPLGRLLSRPLFGRLGAVEQYTQELAVRSGAALANVAPLILCKS